MTITLIPLLGLLIAAPATAVPPRALPQPQVKALTGNWAGDGFALRVATTGYVVQGTCAAGKITSPVMPDASGRFTASGYYNAYTSGYRLSDLAPSDQPAIFKGKVTGNSLELTMRVAGRPEESHYVLKRGAAIKFPKCD